MNYRENFGPIQRFDIGEGKKLVIHREESSGFAPMRIVDDEDGSFMPVTMQELLNAVSAAYYCQKDKKKK